MSGGASAGAVAIRADAAGPIARDFAPRLIDWQHSRGRHDLPWQRTRDPYRVWLSEIMLQQTQVATVIGYYERFLQRFADVAALAAAPLDDVLAAWSGLGYYSRARHLHRCAQAVVEQHGGAFPRDSATLATLPGIGRSTAAAIAAFCFGERVAILDGNVKRVLTRVLGFGDDLAQARHERRLWDEATRLLPAQGIEAYTQGLMDLGATVCLARAPSCLICPAHGLCAAAAAGDPERYPVKTRTLKRGAREHVWLWLAWCDRIWLTRRPDRGVWAGLWSLPEIDSPARLDALTVGWPGQAETLPSFTHTLTHLDWTLHPVRRALPAGLSADQAGTLLRQLAEALGTSASDGRWFTLDEARAAGLPAPLRRLLG